MSAATGRPSNLEDVLTKLQDCFVKRYRRLNRPQGRKISLRMVATFLLLRRKRVVITDANTEFEGTTSGLTKEGALRVETEVGEIRIVRAGDVSFRCGPYRD